MNRSSYSVAAVRAQFPFLNRRLNGQPIIYFDNAATTQKPQPVLDALLEFYTNHCANIHRGAHTLSEEATELYDRARQRIARFIAADEQEIIFVRNATEGINLIAHALRRPGDFLVPLSEHHSNLLPWRCTRRVQHVAIDRQGRLDLEDLRRKLHPGIGLLALSAVTNALGSSNPFREAIALARSHGVPVLLDASQHIAHHLTDVRELDCDFLVFSGHKMYAPSGIGVLYARAESFALLGPFLLGGGSVKEVGLEHYVPNDYPLNFEAGTPNIEGAIALAAATDFLDQIGFDDISAHESALTTQAARGMAAIAGVTLYGAEPTASRRHPTIAFNVTGVDPHVVARILCNRANVMSRAGLHCAHPLHSELGIGPTVRVSFGVYNTTEEIDAMLNVLQVIKRM